MSRPVVTIRQAREADVPALMAMFASDTEGGHGDTADPVALPDYLAAYRRIEASRNDTLFVAEVGGLVVGTFQTTLATSMTGRGAAKLIVGAVHTRADMRGNGIGETMLRHAIEEGRERGVRLVQLSSNRVRTDAHRFYERLGFEASHLGFRMRLRA